MKIEITTSPQNVEIANFLLAEAIRSARNNPAFMEAHGLKYSSLDHAEKFRKSLVKGFLK